MVFILAKLRVFRAAYRGVMCPGGVASRRASGVVLSAGGRWTTVHSPVTLAPADSS